MSTSNLTIASKGELFMQHLDQRTQALHALCDELEARVEAGEDRQKVLEELAARSVKEMMEDWAMEEQAQARPKALAFWAS